MKALWRGWCGICDRQYGTGDDIAQRGTTWVHSACCNGADDE